jgi:hypothetical protein
VRPSASTSRAPASPAPATRRRGLARCRPARVHPPGLHARRHRRRHGPHAGGVRPLVRDGLSQSPIHQVLIEEDLTGWKEFELEMMRDRRDNVVVVCSIENLDPMGVHTGDSITVAPALTLTDKEYQRMRDAAIAIMRAVGVDTGGSNIQFAVNPRDGRMVVIEMNPRVSRSSALASKATGFPIAKIATKLAIGYTLDEIRNDITRETPACFEPVDRLLRREDAALRVREVPRGGRDADHVDEVGRRGDGDRPHVQGGVPEVHPLDGDQAAGLRPAPQRQVARGPAPAAGRARRRAPSGSTPSARPPRPPAPTVRRHVAGRAPADWQEERTREWPMPDAVLTRRSRRRARAASTTSATR